MSTSTYIFIDGSYICFHRYFALLNWWKMAYPENPIENPIENETFVEKYKKTFVNNIQELKKKLKIDKNIEPILVVGKDCKRENIWRMDLYEKYKANRNNGIEDGFMGGPFFALSYGEDGLFKKAGINIILSHPKLEADDCIAITVKHLLKNEEKPCNIYIITSDKDYLQLSEPRVHLYNLSFKNLAEQKSSFGSPEADLFCKIIMGDVSDNINPVLNKCGPKTALKCYQDRTYFEEKLKKENAQEKYNINKKLVDFNEIPIEYVNEFMETFPFSV